MKKNKQKIDHANYHVPYDVHGTDCSSIGGASPEMTALTEMTMYSNTPPASNITTSKQGDSSFLFPIIFQITNNVI